MKKTALIIVVLFISSFTGFHQTTTIENQSESFTWLLGSWQRVNDPPGKQTFEHWEKSSEHLYQGMGCTLKDGDTIWKETIKIAKVGKDWHFEVLGQKDAFPTVFKITEIANSGFTCENAENEFPKKIEYKLVESGLKARISGGGEKVDFDFRRIH